jgi:hypothetical protein
MWCGACYAYVSKKKEEKKAAEDGGMKRFDQE